MVSGETADGLLEGLGEDVTKGDVAPNGNPQMHSVGPEGQVDSVTAG